MKLKLTKPIKAHGEDVHELTFREPTGTDLRKCGVPVRIIVREDGATENEFNTESVAKYISALCDIPTSSVDQMSVSDFMEATKIVAGFFGKSDSQKKR